jgi:hypothetical protein
MKSILGKMYLILKYIERLRQIPPPSPLPPPTQIHEGFRTKSGGGIKDSISTHIGNTST